MHNMEPKTLQNNSKYAEYDTDGDGIVTDAELSHVTEIKKLEHDLRKQRAQRRMATASLVSQQCQILAKHQKIHEDLMKQNNYVKKGLQK